MVDLPAPIMPTRKIERTVAMRQRNSGARMKKGRAGRPFVAVIARASAEKPR